MVWHAYGKSFRQCDIILAAAVRLSGQLLHAPVNKACHPVLWNRNSQER
jgi:hypothetical protein